MPEAVQEGSANWFRKYSSLLWRYLKY
jgi:hypothetical protein